MSFAAERWSRFADAAGTTPTRHRRRRPGVLVVWRLELTKCLRQIRVQSVIVGCGIVPFLVAAAIRAQSAVPADTLFGQWLHESGFALPMVILGFVGQWVLPLLTALVAGDIFASEDHFGTWKTVLTRSRSRAEVFGGKVLAAITYSLAVLALLAASSLAAGLLLGPHPLVGLTGQLVLADQARVLVAQSWASSVPPVLGFCALAVLLSVLSCNSAIGVGAPVVIGLLMQLTSLLGLPNGVRNILLTTPFAAWHGLWAQAPFYGPLRVGLITSSCWFLVCLAGSWAVFRNRDVNVS